MDEITISKGTSNSIRVSFPYDKDHIVKIKTIDGYKWHPEGKYWSFPYSEDDLKKILSAFSGENINIDPSLQNVAYLRSDTIRRFAPACFDAAQNSQSEFRHTKFLKNFDRLKENSFQENTAQKQLRHIFTTTKNLLNLPIRCPIP